MMAIAQDPKIEARSYDHLIGRNIRAARVSGRLSQERLADLLGLTFQQIQKYENGSNRVTAGRLCQIARVCGVPIARLFSGVPDLETEIPVDLAGYARDRALHGPLVEAVDRLPPKLRTQFRRMAEAMGDALDPVPSNPMPDA
ncbi:MAG: helix-turn-helix domain-containing protein [Alphaproteobacteria bacterium]